MNLIEKIGLPATLELLAEECAELAQAALKLARVQRDENPTPVTRREAVDHLAEECADVGIIINQVKGIPGLPEKVSFVEDFKMKRLAERLSGR